MNHFIDQELKLYTDDEINHLCKFYAVTSIKRSNLRKRLKKNNELITKFMSEQIKKELIRQKLCNSLKERELRPLYDFKSKIERGDI